MLSPIFVIVLLAFVFAVIGMVKSRPYGDVAILLIAVVELLRCFGK